MESHLLQMRGLKLVCHRGMFPGFVSHLLQMRGLKQIGRNATYLKTKVASFTDAWIETSLVQCIAIGHVASFTDAWIETIRTSSAASPEIVASFTDAWIETGVTRR